MSLKYSNKLTLKDFRRHPVWEYTNEHEEAGPDGELVVTPVLKLPVESLEGRFIGTDLILANGQRVFGVLLSLALNNARLTKLVLNFVIYDGTKRFLFRRLAAGVSGLDQLASFLELPLSEIFPIRYDIAEFAVGDPSVVRGEIQQEPSGQLPRAELIKLILQEQRNRLVL
jgi:hypothetical protein